MKLHELSIWAILGIFVLINLIDNSYSFQANSSTYITENKFDLINGNSNSSVLEQRISGGIIVVGTYNTTILDLSGRFGILGENCSNIISSCTGWSVCSSNTQNRICTDTYGCATTQTQSCTPDDGCAQTCKTFNYKCGNATICNKQVNCGSCLLNETCSNHQCIPSPCIPDWQCGHWSDCINNNQTRTCGDLNKCSISIPDISQTRYCQTNITNDTCMENWQCKWTGCDESHYRYSTGCADINNCGTAYTKPDSWQNCNCIPIWKCNFSRCEVSYDITKIIRGAPIRDGIRAIFCKDLNLCKNSTINFANCSLVSEVEAGASEFCHEKYVEIKDKKTGKLVSRLKQSYLEEIKKVDISLTASENLSGYCPHCFNKIKDFEEVDIDCGGPDCPFCKLSSKYFDWLFMLKLLLWMLAVLLIIFFIYKRRKDNIGRILRLIDKGEASLKKHKIKQSKSVYNEVKKDFNELDAPSKKEVKKDILKFYKDIIQAIKRAIVRKHKK